MKNKTTKKWTKANTILSLFAIVGAILVFIYANEIISIIFG